MRLNRQELAGRIEETARAAFEGTRLTESLRASGGWRSTTTAIKKVFGDLGKTLDYLIAASGYVGADDGEWLYDMAWYAESDEGFFSHLAMVLETELKPGGSVLRAAEVDGDFQKLVQARAEVRVWLALVPNPAMTANHIINCKRQACLFAGALPGDTYIFIVYDWAHGITLVERFEVDAVGWNAASQ